MAAGSGLELLQRQNAFAERTRRTVAAQPLMRPSARCGDCDALRAATGPTVRPARSAEAGLGAAATESARLRQLSGDERVGSLRRNRCT
jgi:hypothetical protein